MCYVVWMVSLVEVTWDANTGPDDRPPQRWHARMVLAAASQLPHAGIGR